MSIFNFKKKKETVIFTEDLVNTTKKSKEVIRELSDYSDNTTAFTGNYIERSIYTSSLTFDKMWDCYQQNEWIRACVDTIVDEVVKYKLDVRIKENIENTPDVKKQLEIVKELLNKPNTKIESMDTIRRKYLLDILVFDAGALEIIYSENRTNNKSYNFINKKNVNKISYPKELNAIDGSEIRLNTDKFGDFKEAAYILVQNQKEIASYKVDEIIYFMRYPISGSLYGLSPIDTLIWTILSDNEANDMNRMRLSRDGMVSGLLLLPDASYDEINKVLGFWRSEGRRHGWKFGVTNKKEASFIKISDSNRDMEFMEYQKWLKSKIMSVYGIPPAVLGDIYESTGKLNSSEQREQFKTRVLLPILELEKQRFNTILLKEGFKFNDLEFYHIEPEYLNEELDLERAKVIFSSNNAITIDEARGFLGLSKLDPSIYGERGKELLTSNNNLLNTDNLVTPSDEENKITNMLIDINDFWEKK